MAEKQSVVGTRYSGRGETKRCPLGKEHRQKSGKRIMEAGGIVVSSTWKGMEFRVYGKAGLLDGRDLPLEYIHLRSDASSILRFKNFK